MAHRVFVGLSGGVDSAVSAALLKERGLNVVGVFIKIWQPEFYECTWKEDRLDAMRVAVALGIPFREVDLSEEYKRDVVERMIQDYKRGITPNPDVLCNRHIKFGAFAEWALRLGAEGIATGHYARIRQHGGHRELLRGADRAKDQSYFLYRLNQRDLARAAFPVGNLTKAQVRRHAKRLALPVAEKPDSQGLCFVGDVSMKDFLARYIPLERGRVEDMSGRVVGWHHGAALYTVGQRHGFDIGDARMREVPCYVAGVDTVANTIRVSPNRSDAARKKVPIYDDIWTVGLPRLPLSALAQTRHRGNPVPATVSREGNGLVASFNEPHVAAAGQSIVFYKFVQGGAGDVVLGGAVMG
ncbi:MAG: tRNA 2-thiouridine(34) synthase MnmA [Patescibacteria group bacterium]|nr:tRNA 2-thiouridine(34) synthase MnmA [Patescibacteria group bacterium]